MTAEGPLLGRLLYLMYLLHMVLLRIGVGVIHSGRLAAITVTALRIPDMAQVPCLLGSSRLIPWVGQC